MPDKVSLDTRILQRWFDDREVRDALDNLTVEQVGHLLAGNEHDHGQPVVIRNLSEGQGHWRPGDGRPGLADDDPAVIQAMARCAAHRLRRRLPAPMRLLDLVHPRECSWCDLPIEELLRACDWGTVTSRYVVAERLVWWQHPAAEKPSERGTAYYRSGTSGVYLNAAWAALFALPPDEREARIAAAQYPEEIAA